MCHGRLEGLPPKFLSRGVSEPQVETPNSRETLSRGVKPPPTAALISQATYSRLVRATAQGLRAGPFRLLELSCRADVQ